MTEILGFLLIDGHLMVWKAVPRHYWDTLVLDAILAESSRDLPWDRSYLLKNYLDTELAN